MAVATLTLLGLVTVPSHAFTIKGQPQAASEESEISNQKFEHAALLEAKAYICGTGSEASEAAMQAGMKETGLPEDIAVEVVSDLASGIIDHATKTGSKELCDKPTLRLSRL
ncbi:MAG: hypothetical protein ACRECY_00225 [Phyllobacterium sp.]